MQQLLIEGEEALVMNPVSYFTQIYTMYTDHERCFSASPEQLLEIRNWVDARVRELIQQGHLSDPMRLI